MGPGHINQLHYAKTEFWFILEIDHPHFPVEEDEGRKVEQFALSVLMAIC